MFSETWRVNKAEIWESNKDTFTSVLENEHGVAILLNKKWRKMINWTEHINERAIATSITVNKQLITLIRVYFLHSGYVDHHVQKAYNSIEKMTKSKKNMQIVGEDFNAELGSGIGIERLSVGMYTLKESNSRGAWLKQ